MRQPSLQELLGGQEPPQQVGLEVYDLFCGAGGFSCGSTMAGCRVVFACDECSKAIATHKENHPEATHMCTRLPAPLPLPTDGRMYHLHGSPPCQQFSTVNTRGRSDNKHVQAVGLIEWYLNLALASSATTWSMEQVPTNGVVHLLERLRRQNPKKLAYHVFDLCQLGIPQTRKRLLAGTPWLIARLVRMCSDERRRSVRDVLQTGSATHIQNGLGWEDRHLRHNRQPTQNKYVYVRRELVPDSVRLRPVTRPAPTVLTNGILRWIWWQKGVVRKKRLGVRHVAALQTFPRSYIWPKQSHLAYRQIGNAFPPLLAELLVHAKTTG